MVCITIDLAWKVRWWEQKQTQEFAQCIDGLIEEQEQAPDAGHRHAALSPISSHLISSQTMRVCCVSISINCGRVRAESCEKNSSGGIAWKNRKNGKGRNSSY